MGNDVRAHYSCSLTSDFSIHGNNNYIPHPFSPLSLQPPLETSLSSSLDPFGSPFSHPLSQYISRSHGRAAVFRYVSGESTSERGEDKPIDYMPTSLEDSHSARPIWFTDTETETKCCSRQGYPL